MTLSDGDKAIVREICYEAAKAIGEGIANTFLLQISLHQATCPTALKVRDIRSTGRGMIMGVAGVCGFLGWLIPQVLAWLKS